jgi:hypothetical protein
MLGMPGMPWTSLLCLVSFLCSLPSAQTSSPYTPSASEYPINSLSNPGAAHTFGGDLPASRVHHSISATYNYVLVFGGYSTDGSLLGDINLFYIPSQQWSGPVVRKQCCNNEGEDIETLGADGEIELDIKTGFQGDAPLPRAEHAVCSMHELMYLFGGLTEYAESNDLYTFDPQALRWAVQVGVIIIGVVSVVSLYMVYNCV